MSRITDSQLERAVTLLNECMGRPVHAYERRGDKLVAMIGNFHLSHAYGGVGVVEMVNEAGGVRHACGIYGHVTKRECWNALQAAIWAVQRTKEAA